MGTLSATLEGQRPPRLSARRNTVPLTDNSGVAPVKGSSVKPSLDQHSVRFSAHVVFFCYRWLAWAVAALSLTLPERPVATLPRDAGLLLLIGVINVAATALAQGYVRIARQRPAIMSLDLMAGAAILWLSGSAYLPFMPYALAGLVLPALLFGWRGAMLAAAGFVALDLIGLGVLNGGAEPASPATLMRPLLPLAFAAFWVVAERVVMRAADPGADGAGLTGTMGGRLLDPGPEAPARAPQPSRFFERQRGTSPTPTTSNLTAPGPMVLLRPAAEQRHDLARRVLFDLTPTHAVNTAVSLEQLGASARSDELDVQVSCTGAPRPLTLAQHSLLLRIAHEALLNVQQHARAHKARLTLAYEGDVVALEVCDDGVGLLDGTYERPGLHALRALRYRLAELDGQLAVFEGAEGGVTVRANLPLEP